MEEISVPYTIGSETKQLAISFTSQGTGQIKMDKYYHCQCFIA